MAPDSEHLGAEHLGGENSGGEHLDAVTEFLSDGPVSTRSLGARLGRMLWGGEFVALYGELGAGKTTFVQGLAEGLGVTDRYITSPSFALVNQYEGRSRFYHIDLYRLNGPEDLADIGFDEFPGEGVAAVEWPQRAGDDLPADRLDISIVPTGESERKLRLVPHGARYERLVEELCRTSRPNL